jgi:dUTP pyrophosphatase
MNTKVYFAKVNPNAKIPSKRIEDAGFDIYACFEDEYMVIAPHETRLIPTGIASVCSSDYCFVLKERGSTGTKGIAQRCGIIDSGYRNEWFVPITNTTDKWLVICKETMTENKLKDAVWQVRERFRNILHFEIQCYPYEKAICQVLVIPVPQTEVEEITFDKLQSFKSERGNGALGSSGK